MPYPTLPDFHVLADQLKLYMQRQHEYGAAGITSVLVEAERALRMAVEALKQLPVDEGLAAKEPNKLEAIRALRPTGPRMLWPAFQPAAYRERLEGALLARFAGCTLGAPVEFWEVDRMERLARENGQAFPPTEYWRRVPDDQRFRYGTSRHAEYTQQAMTGVPVDDDIAYTLLGLLIVEDHGLDFTMDDVGIAWVKYLPIACTAEEIALKNLKQGIPAAQAGEVDNPYCEWIGADIRSDPWGYLAPGCPERAARMAYTDAYLSHRRNGIYGEMYFAAVIAAAFAVDDPVEALHIGLTEIPTACALAQAVRWALDIAPEINDYRAARQATDQRFAGMSGVHTILNACLTIWGITLGGTDLTRVIGETVAMGQDNDCTAATAGSIVGAVVGKAGIPTHWYAPFNDTVHSYLIDQPQFAISDLIERFAAQAEKAYADGPHPACPRS